MKRLRYPSPEFDALLRDRRPTQSAEVQDSVAKTIEDVRANGDEAVLRASRAFDCATLDRVVLDPAEYAEVEVTPELEAALLTATRRIADFHYDQKQAIFGGWSAQESAFESTADVAANLDLAERAIWRTAASLETSFIGQRVMPVYRAGVYAPGGRAVYPSSVLMNALPAVAAGVHRLVIATPAGPDGTLAPTLRRAVQAVDEYGGFFKEMTVAMAGGAAAIAAMALGTESVPKCDVVVGPGNEWVNEAKRQLWGECGFDGYAGPSEVAVLVDDTAEYDLVAADLLTQIEHGPGNRAFIVATSEEALSGVVSAAEAQLGRLAPGSSVHRNWPETAGVVAPNLVTACEIVNPVAPEHLSIAVADEVTALDRVRNAGAILVGRWTSESGGDYAIGPSHTLPTSGAARWQSPVNVLTFLKLQSVMRLDRSGYEEIAEAVEALAEAEGFPAHAFGSQIRREGRSP